VVDTRDDPNSLGETGSAADAFERAVRWRREFLNHFPDTAVAEKPAWWGAVAELNPYIEKRPTDRQTKPNG